MSSTTQPQKKLRVGIIGSGEVAQVVHLPTLALLSDLFETVAIADISKQSVEHCAKKFHIPKATTDAEEVVGDPEVDVVFILTSDDSHAPLAISALQHDKNVLIEKPITLSIPSCEAIIAAEEESLGRVFVGYMRRYAAAFTDCFLKEVRSIPRIRHATVRDIVGPNSHFVGQSGTFPKKLTDDIPAAASKKRDQRLDQLFAEAFPNQERTKAKVDFWRFLGSLGSHDLSLMRETLGGVPDSVVGVAANEPFYTALFRYTRTSNNSTNDSSKNSSKNASTYPLTVTYETGIDTVPRFDASVEVFGDGKTVKISYDSPYVKALPIEVVITEMDKATGGRSERRVLASYEDAYTRELREVHRAFGGGPGAAGGAGGRHVGGLVETVIKTSAEDALEDLRVFDMLLKKAFA